MIKYILLTGLLMVSVLASAQDKFNFDVHAGAGLTNLHGGNMNLSADSKSKAGFTAGVGATYKISELWFLQAEVNYQNMGGGPDKTLLIPLQFYKKYTLQYASLPFLIKLKIPRSGFGIFAGPQYSDLINNKLKTQTGYLEESNRLRKYDFSALVGAEYFFHLKGGNQIGISGRYQSGILNIGDFGGKEIYIRNKGFALTVGYRFD